MNYKKFLKLIKENYDDLVKEGIEAAERNNSIARGWNINVYVALFLNGYYKTYAENAFPADEHLQVVQFHSDISISKDEMEEVVKAQLDFHISQLENFILNEAQISIEHIFNENEMNQLYPIFNGILYTEGFSHRDFIFMNINNKVGEEITNKVRKLSDVQSTELLKKIYRFWDTEV